MPFEVPLIEKRSVLARLQPLFDLMTSFKAKLSSTIVFTMDYVALSQDRLLKGFNADLSGAGWIPIPGWLVPKGEQWFADRVFVGQSVATKQVQFRDAAGTTWNLEPGPLTSARAVDVGIWLYEGDQIGVYSTANAGDTYIGLELVAVKEYLTR